MIALLAFAILADPRQSPEDRCRVQVTQVCSAQQGPGDPCDVDGTRWVQATTTGACGPRPPQWSVSPGHPDGWINGWHRDADVVECGEDEYGSTIWCAARAWLRGPDGSYVVRATTDGGQIDEIKVRLGEPTPIP
jgi:hypothetical protein